MTTIDHKELTWSSTGLLCDKVLEISNAKTYVFADSVLCLGSIGDQPVEAWKNKIKWYLETRYLNDLNQIDEEPMEFEWKIFHRAHYFEPPRTDSTFYERTKV